MNAKEKLIMFVQLKNGIIEEKTGIQYANVNDIMDINDWNMYECEYIYNSVVNAIDSRYAEELYSETCIWCIKYNDNGGCINCGYGERHGVCDNIGSSYSRYNREEIDEVFTNDKYKSMLKQIEDM